MKKINYEEIKRKLLKLRNQPEIMIQLVDEYLEHTDIELERIELRIIMEKILPSDLSEKYTVMNDTSYLLKRTEIEMEKEKNPLIESKIGLGFIVLFDSYNKSEIILNDYAERMIQEIIEDNQINLEKLLHSQFSSPEEINIIGLNTYILKLINNYDSTLSDYLTTHLELIKPIIINIKKIQENWDKYHEKEELKRYNQMFQMVHEYLSISNSNMSETEVLYAIAIELGIVEKVKKYDIPCDIDEEFLIENIHFDIDNSLVERRNYLTVKNIIINQLFSNQPKDLYSFLEDDQQSSGNHQSNCKIIKFNPNEKHPIS